MKTLNYSFILYIYYHIFSIVNSQLNAKEQRQDVDFVFSSQYITKLDITNPQGAATKIKIAQKSNLVFISAGMEGIIVLDGRTNSIIYQYSTTYFINTLDVTQDGNYLITNLNNSLAVMSFQGYQSLTLLCESPFPTSIIDMLIDNSEKRAYVVGVEGSVVAYDISNKYQVKMLTAFNAQSVIIHSVTISPDDNWLLLGNDLVGLTILKITTSNLSNNISGSNYQLSLSLAAQGIPKWRVFAARMTNDMKYIYTIENWFGVFISEFGSIQSADPSQYPLPISFTGFWPFQKINPATYSLIFMQNCDYLLVGVRSQGVYILNIKDKLNPVIFQTLSVGANAFSIALSPNENQIYYSNGLSVQVFQKTLLNLNDDIPNIFNAQQSYFGQADIDAFYKWRCQIHEINSRTYFFGAYDINGLFIYDVTNPYTFDYVYSKVFDVISLVDTLLISQDLQFMFLPVQENNTSIIVYNIADIYHPIEVYRLFMEQTNHDETMVFSKDQSLMAVTFDDGVLLVDSSQIPKIFLLDYWKKLSYMSGENAGVIITDDNKFIIGSVRGFGYYSLSIHLKNTSSSILVWENSLQTLGGEGIVKSLYYSQYAYIFDGFRGIGILDLTTLPQLTIISRLDLVGWSNFIVPYQNDNFLFVADIDAGMLSLIDARDKSNLFLISTFQYEGQSAQSICITQDENFMYINNNLGSLMIPIQTQLLIQTELFNVVTDNSGKISNIPIKQNQFMVGQQIQMTFLFLFPVEGQEIISTQYYFQNQIYNIPNWISFDASSQDIVITVDKQGLSSSNSTQTQNIILLKTAFPLASTSFIFNLADGNSTTDKDSTIIFNTLKTQQLITSQNFVSDSFDYTIPQQLIVNGVMLSDSLQQAIKQTLQMSIFINQVVFYVKPSLFLNLTDPLTPIQTLASFIEVYFEVQSGEGQFLDSDFSGVITSSSQGQDQLKLEGQLDNINEALKQKVIFFPMNNSSAISVTILIIDGLNYPLTQVMPISSCSIIKQKQQIQNNPNESLQTQFNKKYPGSEIYIATLFSIEFSQSSFLVSDVSTYKLIGYIIHNNQTIEIQSDSWIQFRVNNQYATIEGTPPESLLYSVVHIRIVADDGYTQTYDEFSISVYGVPFLYVLNLLIQIIGPSIALVKIYFSRYIFLNCIKKKKVTFSKEQVQSGQLYSKIFILMGDDMEKSINLFQSFVQQQQTSKTNKNKNSLKNNTFETLNKTPNLQQNESEMNQNLSKSLCQSLDKTIDENDLGADQNNKSNYSATLKKYSTQIVKSINKHLSTKSQLQQQGLNNIEFIDSCDGRLKMSKIIKIILDSKSTFRIRGKKYISDSFILDFQNKDSRIYKGVQALAARYFLKKDNKCYLLYKYLKQYSLDHFNFTQNDWYLAYVNINITERKDHFGMQVPFPDLSLKSSMINSILADVSQANYKITLELAKTYGINTRLLEEVLFADALGLVDYIPENLQPCIGESIHLHSYQIRGVQTYKQVSESRFKHLRRAFNMEFEEYGTSKNRSLPIWLNMEHNNGVISLQGIPMSQDVEEILIRITNSKDYVVKQFIINITANSNQQQQYQSSELEEMKHSTDIKLLRKRNTRIHSNIREYKSQRVMDRLHTFQRQQLSQSFIQSNEQISSSDKLQQLTMRKNLSSQEEQPQKFETLFMKSSNKESIKKSSFLIDKTATINQINEKISNNFSFNFPNFTNTERHQEQLRRQVIENLIFDEPVERDQLQKDQGFEEKTQEESSQIDYDASQFEDVKISGFPQNKFQSYQQHQGEMKRDKVNTFEENTLCHNHY